MTKDEILNMPAGAKMNQSIWWKVFDMFPSPSENDMALLPDYSENMNEAKNVSDKMKYFVLVRLNKDEWCCNHIAFANTAPLAICRAALLEAFGLE